MSRLVADGVLSPDQADAVVAALDAAETAAPRRGPAGWLVEIGGYLGGGLMLGGVLLFLGATWDSLGQGARTGLLAGFAVLFVLAGILVAGGPAAVRRLAAAPTTARRRVVGVLLALASVPAAFAVGVAVDRYDGALGALVGFAVALAGLLWLPNVAGVMAAAIMSTALTAAFGGEVLRVSSLGVGLLLLALGAIWLAVAVARLVAPTWLGVGIGATLALVGAQLPLDDNGTEPWAYALTAAVSVGFLVLYRWRREVVLLVAGVVGATIAVPEAIADLTDGAVSGSVILLVAGAVLIAMSAVGLRLRAAAAASPDEAAATP